MRRSIAEKLRRRRRGARSAGAAAAASAEEATAAGLRANDGRRGACDVALDGGARAGPGADASGTKISVGHGM